MRHTRHCRALSVATDITLIKSLSVSTLQPISMLGESLAQTQELVGNAFIFSVKSAVNVHIGHVAGSTFSNFPENANLKFDLSDSIKNNQLAFPFFSMVVAWLVLGPLEEHHLKFAMSMTAHFIARIFCTNHI